MTRLEKAKELHPDLSNEVIVVIHCPEQLLPIELFSCEKSTCGNCWNQEYKEGEQV